MSYRHFDLRTLGAGTTPKMQGQHNRNFRQKFQKFKAEITENHPTPPIVQVGQ